MTEISREQIQSEINHVRLVLEEHEVPPGISLLPIDGILSLPALAIITASAATGKWEGILIGIGFGAFIPGLYLLPTIGEFLETNKQIRETYNCFALPRPNKIINQHLFKSFLYSTTSGILGITGVSLTVGAALSGGQFGVLEGGVATVLSFATIARVGGGLSKETYQTLLTFGGFFGGLLVLPALGASLQNGFPWQGIVTSPFTTAAAALTTAAVFVARGKLWERSIRKTEAELLKHHTENKRTGVPTLPAPPKSRYVPDTGGYRGM